MSLPTPNLDDRTWEDIVQEAKKRIPALCPDWTDFNASDPGMTLVELMAWMSEMLLYRLNRVPDKIYIKFLEFIGMTLRPPCPANTKLQFYPVQGAANVKLPLIPEGTHISAPDENGDPIVFETREDFNLNSSRLLKAFSRFNDRYHERTTDFTGNVPTRRFSIFKTEHAMPHSFFLGDPEIALTGNDFALKLYVIMAAFGRRLNLKWSTWDGEKWHVVAPSRDETDRLTRSGEIYFHSLPEMKRKSINGITNYWLRLDLEGYDGESLPQVLELKKSLELKKESGIPPDRGYSSSEEIPFQPIQFQGVFLPFNRDAKTNNALYIASEAFGRRTAPVTLDIRLADSYIPPKLETLSALEIYWEYYSESGEWNALGVTTPMGILSSRWGFNDSTEAFTHNGKVLFHVPDDIAQLGLLGEVRYWIRARIHRGNYGEKKKLYPPLCTQVSIHFKESPGNFEEYVAYNEFIYDNLTPQVKSSEIFQPFYSNGVNQPEFYLGFDSSFSNKLHRLYFRLVRSGQKNSEVVWEYSTGEVWKHLDLSTDETRHFTRRGYVQFIGPDDWEKQRTFGHECFWLRVRWLKYDPDRPPRMRYIHPNFVRAIQGRSFRNEVLGSGNGQSFQGFYFKNKPIMIYDEEHNPTLAPRIMVKELDRPTESEINAFVDTFKKEMREDDKDRTDTELQSLLRLEKDHDTKEIVALWVEWRQRENFFFSTPQSRHYILDIYNGLITFGDGLGGRIPPIGSDNIKCAIYYIGGGARGNLGKNTIVNLESPISFVDTVTNPYPSVGGEDMESLAQVKQRAPWFVKHRNRAVSARDFEKISLESSNQVARAVCWSEKEGQIKVIIWPEGKGAHLQPSDALIQLVTNYLDQRRLLTTRLEVAGPVYTDISLRVTVVLQKHMEVKSDAIKKNIQDDLQHFFHPLKGGPYDRGWPRERWVYRSEARYIAEGVGGVEQVEEILLYRHDGERTLEQARVKMEGDRFPRLKKVEVVIRSGGGNGR